MPLILNPSCSIVKPDEFPGLQDNIVENEIKNALYNGLERKKYASMYLDAIQNKVTFGIVTANAQTYINVASKEIIVLNKDSIVANTNFTGSIFDAINRVTTDASINRIDIKSKVPYGLFVQNGLSSHLSLISHCDVPHNESIKALGDYNERLKRDIIGYNPNGTVCFRGSKNSDSFMFDTNVRDSQYCIEEKYFHYSDPFAGFLSALSSKNCELRDVIYTASDNDSALLNKKVRAILGFIEKAYSKLHCPCQVCSVFSKYKDFADALKKCSGITLGLSDNFEQILKLKTMLYALDDFIIQTVNSGDSYARLRKQFENEAGIKTFTDSKLENTAKDFQYFYPDTYIPEPPSFDNEPMLEQHSPKIQIPRSSTLTRIPMLDANKFSVSSYSKIVSSAKDTIEDEEFYNTVDQQVEEDAAANGMKLLGGTIAGFFKTTAKALIDLGGGLANVIMDADKVNEGLLNPLEQGSEFQASLARSQERGAKFRETVSNPGKVVGAIADNVANKAKDIQTKFHNNDAFGAGEVLGDLGADMLAFSGAGKLAVKEIAKVASKATQALNGKVINKIKIPTVFGGEAPQNIKVNSASSNLTKTFGNNFPERELPKCSKTGEPIPDVGFENTWHSQLGTRLGSKGSYPKAREFGPDNKVIREIEGTDHGRADHPNPHQHRYVPNKTGGTRRRGPTEPFDDSLSNIPESVQELLKEDKLNSFNPNK